MNTVFQFNLSSSISIALNILNCFLIISVILFLINFRKYLMQKNKIRKYEIDLNSNISHDDIINELDQFILSCWEEYYITTIAWSNRSHILSESEEAKVIKELAVRIGKSISPIMVSTLSIFYNPTKDQNGVSSIDNLIAGKIQMVVMNYNIEQKNKK